MKEKNQALQGLRCIAILLVVTSHCRILAQGQLGNCLFFTISGFFACSPFLSNYEEKFFKPLNGLKFYYKKIVRIVPTYWACIIGIFLVLPNKNFILKDFSSFDSLLLNLLFIKCKDVLWFIQQEMFFYLILPFILIIIGLIKRLIRLIVKKESICDLIIAFILIPLVFFFSTHWYVMLYGNGGLIGFRFNQFLIGMVFGYLYKAVKDLEICKRDSKALNVATDIYVIGFILFCIFSSTVFLEKIISNPSEELLLFGIGWANPVLCGALTGVFMIMVLVAGNALFTRAMGNKVFVYIGEISFPVYLIHRFLILELEQASPVRTFISVFTLSVILASVIHKYVEKPSTKFIK